MQQTHDRPGDPVFDEALVFRSMHDVRWRDRTAFRTEREVKHIPQDRLILISQRAQEVIGWTKHFLSLGGMFPELPPLSRVLNRAPK